MLDNLLERRMVQAKTVPNMFTPRMAGMQNQP